MFWRNYFCALIAYLAKDERKEVTITEIVDEHTVLVEEDMSEWGGQLFVWGQKVDDFHHLNKDYIWTVATAALQEVDRQLQAEKTRNDALESRILALENKLKKTRVAPFYFQKIVYISGYSARVSVSSVYLSRLRVGTLSSFFFFYKLHFYFRFWLTRG